MKVIPFVPNGSNVISSQPIKLISTANSPISSKSGIPAQPKYHTVVAQPTGPIKKNGTASGEGVKLQKVEKIEHIENNEENTKNNYVSIAGGQSAGGQVGTGQPVGSAAPLQLYDKNSLMNTEVPREALLKLTLERDDSPDAFHPFFSSPEKVIEYIQRIGNPCEYPYVTIPGKFTFPWNRSRPSTVPSNGPLEGSARKILLDIQKCIDACRRNKIFYGDELVQVKTFNHVSGMKRYGSMESNPHECKICTALNCNRSVHKIFHRVNLPLHH